MSCDAALRTSSSSTSSSSTSRARFTHECRTLDEERLYTVQPLLPPAHTRRRVKLVYIVARTPRNDMEAQ